MATSSYTTTLVIRDPRVIQKLEQILNTPKSYPDEQLPKVDTIEEMRRCRELF
ncbi:hypothetical protein LJC08_02630 [Methanimicrococcus sp. OttesenSCG-928-J09]|nr:hypothetical protein [Methanimicrococcus sp. OttesenSCG-928-J09]